MVVMTQLRQCMPNSCQCLRCASRHFVHHASFQRFEKDWELMEVTFDPKHVPIDQQRKPAKYEYEKHTLACAMYCCIITTSINVTDLWNDWSVE